MKRLALRLTFMIAAVGLVAVAGQAHAENYGTAGCGLGAMAFKDQPGNIQILAATLNNIISPQTSAITSGTSNCYDDPRTASAMFITVNQQALRKDISRGGGESVASLSRILKCSDDNRLGSVLQMNYGSIFPTDSVTPEQINKTIHETILGDEKLSQNCNAVI